MLCRNLFFLKSNQYSRSVSLNSWYILVCCISLFAIKFTPHFSLRKYLGKRRFPQILKLPFFPVFTILWATFVLYFQTTYYRHVAGAEMAQFIPLPRGQPGPPIPGFPHSRRAGRDIPGTAMRLLCVSENVSQKYLQLRKARIKNEIHYLGASSIR